MVEKRSALLTPGPQQGRPKGRLFALENEGPANRDDAEPSGHGGAEADRWSLRWHYGVFQPIQLQGLDYAGPRLDPRTASPKSGA